MAQLVIFDCDGVLVDSEIIICRIEAKELTRIGFAITPEEMAARFVGISAETTYAEVEAELSRALPSGHEERVERLVAEAFDHELEPIPGIHEALGDIDLPICVASSGRGRSGFVGVCSSPGFTSASLPTSSVPTWSRAISRHQICSSALPSAWALRR